MIKDLIDKCNSENARQLQCSAFTKVSELIKNRVKMLWIEAHLVGLL